MFDVSVSSYRTYGAAPVTIPLSRWIKSTMNPNGKYVTQVKQYRQTKSKKLKEQLPCVTVSALCRGGHKKTDVVNRTGWIALDIDSKDNPQLKDTAALRDQIGNISFIAFAGLSVSANGVWALVKVKNPQKQDLYFQQLQADFQHLGITLDSSKGANPSDLRFYSFDPNAYVGNEIAVYDRLPIQQPTGIPEPPAATETPPIQGNDTKAKVEALISKIQARRIDITTSYQSWRDLGFALEDEFEEAGRKYFHTISQYHSNYNRRDCNQQFTSCLEHAGSGRGIGTFFHVCKQHGITLNNNLNGSTGKYESQKKGDPAPHGYNPFTGEIFDQRGYPCKWDSIPLDEK